MNLFYLSGLATATTQKGNGLRKGCANVYDVLFMLLLNRGMGKRHKTIVCKCSWRGRKEEASARDIWTDHEPSELKGLNTPEALRWFSRKYLISPPSQVNVFISWLVTSKICKSNDCRRWIHQRFVTVGRKFILSCHNIIEIYWWTWLSSHNCMRLARVSFRSSTETFSRRFFVGMSNRVWLSHV